jgi:hypothetical protein
MNGYKNIKPLTKEILANAIGAGKPKEKGSSVKALLAEPHWSRRAKVSEEESELHSGHQDVIQGEYRNRCLF